MSIKDKDNIVSTQIQYQMIEKLSSLNNTLVDEIKTRKASEIALEKKHAELLIYQENGEKLRNRTELV